MLQEQKINELLKSLPLWTMDNGQLVREVKFQDFLDAVGFINNLIPICEEMNHHPDIHLSFCKMRLNLFTHSASAVTELDFILAKTLEKILSTWPTLKNNSRNP
ncbi:MAG: 4a-hydroxytetrahydrobiopterin dehydratase [Elusimicrobiota bacterium]